MTVPAAPTGESFHLVRACERARSIPVNWVKLTDERVLRLLLLCVRWLGEQFFELFSFVVVYYLLLLLFVIVCIFPFLCFFL